MYQSCLKGFGLKSFGVRGFSVMYALFPEIRPIEEAVCTRGVDASGLV